MKEGKHKYKGTFNVAGEVTYLYGWYKDTLAAERGFRRKLKAGYRRTVFLQGTDYRIERVEDGKQ